MRHRQHSDFPTGTVHLNDTAAHVEFDSTRISSFTISGDDATATGSGSANGQPVTFTLRVHDHPDTFSLELSNSYAISGPLKSGKIEIHPC